VEYRIDREALAAFWQRRLTSSRRGRFRSCSPRWSSCGCGHETSSRDEVRARSGLGAGLATHVGLAIFEEPERFITAGEPSPASPAALAA